MKKLQQLRILNQDIKPIEIKAKMIKEVDKAFIQSSQQLKKKNILYLKEEIQKYFEMP